MLPVLKRLNHERCIRVLWHARWLYLQQKTDLPRPVSFSLVCTVIMFILLPMVPSHPMSIPVVIGAGVCGALLLRGGIHYAAQ